MTFAGNSPSVTHGYSANSAWLVWFWDGGTHFNLWRLFPLATDHPATTEYLETPFFFSNFFQHMESSPMNSDIQSMLNQCSMANGMLPSEVYCRLYQSVQSIPSDPILEIGTAHAAGTIAIALGSKHYATSHSIITTDLFGGRFSSRRSYGNEDQNLRIVLDNLKRAGVSDRVHVFKGSSVDLASSQSNPSSISMLMLDADGRIDRDFLLFYPKVREGGIIVIDDADSEIYLSLNHDREPYLDLKHRITSLLVQAFHRAGFITDLEMVSNTLFCRSTGKPLDASEFTSLSLDVYRELVFAPVSEKWLNLVFLQTCSVKAIRALAYYDRIERLFTPFKRLLSNSR